MATRIYIVRNKQKDVFLVQATSQSQAVGHVVKGEYTCEVAGQVALVEAINAGVKVETAGEQA